MERKWKLGVDLDLDDMMLNGLTFEVIVTTLYNEPVITKTVVRTIVKDILKMQLDYFKFLLENNMDEIIEYARQGDIDT